MEILYLFTLIKKKKRLLITWYEVTEKTPEKIVGINKTENKSEHVVYKRNINSLLFQQGIITFSTTNFKLGKEQMIKAMTERKEKLGLDDGYIEICKSIELEQKRTLY